MKQHVVWFVDVLFTTCRDFYFYRYSDVAYVIFRCFVLSLSYICFISPMFISGDTLAHFGRLFFVRYLCYWIVVFCDRWGLLCVDFKIFFLLEYCLVFFCKKLTSSLERCVHYKWTFFLNIEQRELIEVDLFGLTELSWFIDFDSVFGKILLSAFGIKVDVGLEELIGTR